MKLTPAQKKELVVWRYFLPEDNWEKETEEDIKKFFEWSEKGLHKEVKYGDMSYFNALRQGKRWAGIHMHEMYEQGILDGSVPYFTLLGGFDNNKKWWQFWKSPHNAIPRAVVDFMKKEMFRGADSEIIEDAYKIVLGTK